MMNLNKFKGFRLSVLAAVLVLGGLLLNGSGQNPNERVGRKEYIEGGCHYCHGYEGQGGVAMSLAPEPLAIEAFTEVVRRPYGVMPAYPPKLLSDEKLKRLYQYMKSIPPPPDVSTLPIFSEN